MAKKIGPAPNPAPRVHHRGHRRRRRAATSRVLGACTAIATRGSVNTAVPFDPATVEITPGSAPNTTGIQVRQLLFFGGNLASESFHAAMIC
jgi:hypothetical protein